jgi:hypothetical protein
MSILQTAMDAGRLRSPVGLPGDWAAHSDHDKWVTLWNQAPMAKKIVTTTITDPGDNIAMTLTVEGYAVTVNTGVGLDATGIAAAIALAINLDPRIRGNVAASSAAAVLTLTSVNEGYDFSIAEADANLSTPVVVQAAATAAAVPCGRCMISQGRLPNWPERLGALAASTLLVAQVLTITVGYQASEVLVANVYEVRGAERELIASARVVSATSQDATLDALATALTTELTGLPVTVASAPASATGLVFTSSLPGYEFDVDIVPSGGAATRPTVAKVNTTGPNAQTSIHRALAGVSQRPQDEMATSVGALDVEWPANRGVRASIVGEVFVENAEAVTEGAPCFIELGVPADNGQLFLVKTATRVQLARNMIVWQRRGYPSGDNVAAVRLNIPG